MKYSVISTSAHSGGCARPISVLASLAGRVIHSIVFPNEWLAPNWLINYKNKAWLQKIMIAAFLMIFICVLIVSISFGLLKKYVFEKDLAVVIQVFFQCMTSPN